MPKTLARKLDVLHWGVRNFISMNLSWTAQNTYISISFSLLQLVASGWGLTSYYNDDVSNVLQKVSPTIKSKQWFESNRSKYSALTRFSPGKCGILDQSGLQRRHWLRERNHRSNDLCRFVLLRKNWNLLGKYPVIMSIRSTYVINEFLFCRVTREAPWSCTRMESTSWLASPRGEWQVGFLEGNTLE